MDVGRLFDNVTALAGVEGVWLFRPDGLVHVHRAPQALSGDPVEVTWARIQALYAEMDTQLDDVDDYLLKFEERWLLLRRAGEFTLVVLATDAASPAAVRMVTNVLTRNLSHDAVALLHPAPPVAPSATAPAESATPGTEAPDDEALLAPKRPVRMYRGQPY